MFSAPPEALRPYSVPCGPRRTSTRSMSRKDRALAPDRPMDTSSIEKPMDGSLAAESLEVPTPRM